MGDKKTKTRGKTTTADQRRQRTIEQVVRMIRREVREKLGPDSTFEQRRDAAADLMKDALWKDEDEDLDGLRTNAEEIEVEGRRYRRLAQPSSATYYGRWGEHKVEEPLYREVGKHNGPTIKPIELRVGMIARHMTPDMARIVGELGADCSSRQLQKTLRTVGLVPPSRAVLERRFKQMAAEIADEIEVLEERARQGVAVPQHVAAISCGMDRFSVRMSEPSDDPEQATPPRRTEPYVRTPPPPKEYHYRKAWVGTTTIYDEEGNELHTWRYATEADHEPGELAERVAADVAWVLGQHPQIPVHVIQDAAPELRILPTTLTEALPANCSPRELVDLEHLMGYLDDVVDACEAEGDPRDMKGWYRGELLRDDRAIDRIFRSLQQRARTLPGRSTRARKAVAAALRYIRHRKDKMRYASFHSHNLPVGSGATESTCWLMQDRVKRAGQSWEVPGLRATLAVRALVLSDRWKPAWEPYAASHRKEIRLGA
jgi:hypothetical protein